MYGLGRRCLVPNSPIPSRVMDCFTRSATLRSWVPVDYVARLTHGLIREHTRWHPDLSTYTAVFGRGPMSPSVTATLGVSVPTFWLSPQTPRCTVGKHPSLACPACESAPHDLRNLLRVYAQVHNSDTPCAIQDLSQWRCRSVKIRLMYNIDHD